MMKIRKWRYLLWTALGLITLVALFYAIENFRGARAWAKAKDAYLAAGHSLDWDQVWPNRLIPDEENFAVVDLLRNLTTPFAQPGGEEGAANREALINSYQHLPAGPPRSMVSKASRRTIDPFKPKAWRDYLTGHAWPVPPDEPDDARAILTAVEAQWSLGFKALDQVAMRPKAQFSPPLRTHWDRERPETLATPHFNAARSLARLLRLRTLAAIHCGERQVAKRSLASGFRLTEAVQSDPTLISVLVSNTQVAMFMNPIYESLQSHFWTKSDLQWLESELGAIKLPQSLAQSLKSETIFLLTGIDRMSKGSFAERRQLISTYSPTSNDVGPSKRNAILASYLAPSGWSNQNRAHVVSHYQSVIEGLQRSTLDPMLLTKQPQSQSVYGFVSRLLAPLSNKAIQGTALVQVMVGQARVACLLESYHLQHQRYPESLEVLGDVSVDPLGKPWRYATTDNGTTYTLYSVGWNLTDEGGEINDKERWKADWVWGKR